MATVKFNKQIFEREVGKLTEELQNKIALFGTTVEYVSDNEVEIDVTPNRPDLLSYHGFKRGFLAFIEKKQGLKEYKVLPPEKDYTVKIDSSVKEVRPYTVCAIIKGLKFDDDKIKEIIEIQEKLHQTIGRKRKKLAIGIYPLEKIKMPIKFMALEPDKIKFQPLESPREMSGLQILQRHPTGKDYAHLLSGKSKFPVFIDSNNEILSMPPIINSELTGRITEQTKEVFVECSGFDINILNKCLNIVVTTLAEMGGKIYQVNLQGSPIKKTPDLSPEKNKISIENVNKTLGLELTEKEIKTNLEKMGHSYKKGEVMTPAWRTDILHEVDLIEDVAIGYGYDNFEAIIPEISTIGSEDPEATIKRKIAEILSGLGLLEVSNYHLTKIKDQYTKLGVPKGQEKGHLEVEESKTEYNILRKDLSHYLLKNLSENVDTEYPQRIFEVGTVFKDEKETTNLSIALAPGYFTELKQMLGYLARMLGMEFKLEEDEKPENHYIEGRTGRILLDEKEIGKIGEIHPKILKNLKVKMPISLLEINLEDIFKKLI